MSFKDCFNKAMFPLDRPKWRDEKVLLRAFCFPLTLGICAVVIENNRSYAWVQVVLFSIISHMLGYLNGHGAGKEVERLFPKDLNDGLCHCPVCKAVLREKP